MGLSCGIVGLPNVGKSTLFSTLTKSMAESQNYPFTTIDPNVGIVNVPDYRLHEIAKIVNPQRIVPSTVRFVDVAGLVRGASQGEGLGNKFLSHIRDVDAIIQVVRLFEDDNIIHVDGKVEPLSDLETIMTELILRDIEILTARKQKIEKLSKTDKDMAYELSLIETFLEGLNNGKSLKEMKVSEEELPQPLKDLRLITIKPMLIAANMDEQSIGEYQNHPQFKALKQKAATMDIEVLAFCAKLELDMMGLSLEEQQEMMDLYNIKEKGLEQIIAHGYSLLNYMSYFTAGEKEVRSWTILKNTKAPQAAAAIHTDFEKGFIKAEVIHYDDFITCDGAVKAKEQGKMQIEGKDYVVQDGDVILFRFNN
jgi:GTP-binding protein YchF